MKNLKTYESFNMNEAVETEPTAKDTRVDASNIDKLTFKAYINSGAQSPMPGGGKFPYNKVDTLENINKYAEKYNLTWMWHYDNGYSNAGEDPSTFENVKKGILNHSIGKTVWLSTTKEGWKHRSDS